MSLKIKGRVQGNMRKDRGKSQRIFLILSHNNKENNLERMYDVMGTTGNVYTVSIKTSPSCTCPDHTTRFRRCKHIYFVLTRIMKVRQEHEDIEKYSDEDLELMFENIPDVTNNLKVDTSQLNKYKKMKKTGNGEVCQKELYEDDQCPICLDDLDNCDEELVFCRYYCGNSIHAECFNMYNSKQNQVKCLYCMHQWEKDIAKYINLE